MRIGHAKDFWSGVLFAAIGLAFAFIAKGIRFGDTVLLAGYAMGSPARMGPAFFPFWLGMILFFLGLAIAVMGFRHESRPGDTEFPRFHWRPILFILGAVVMFGVILKAAGMLLAGFLLVMVAGLGDPDFQWKKTVVLAVALVIFCAVVFVGGLKLPIPLCPNLELFQGFKICRG